MPFIVTIHVYSEIKNCSYSVQKQDKKGGGGGGNKVHSFCSTIYINRMDNRISISSMGYREGLSQRGLLGRKCHFKFSCIWLGNRLLGITVNNL